MSSSSDNRTSDGWQKDRAPQLNESYARRRSIFAAVILPMSLFVAFAASFAALFWKQDRTAHAVQVAKEELREGLAAMSQLDAQRLDELAPEQSVRQLASDLLHVSMGVQEYPGDTVMARFDGLVTDYSLARATLATRSRLPAGDTPVSDTLMELLANSDKGLTAGDNTPAGQEGPADGAVDSACACEAPNVIFFPIDSRHLTPPARRQIRALADRWKSTSRQSIRVRGFADALTGKAQFNRLLSIARAEAVAEYLRRLVGGNEYVTATGFDGEELPSYDGFDPNDVEYRRVAVVQLAN